MELELICDDVMRGLASLPAESVDVVVTSPDYNLGIKYKSSQSVQRTQDYLDWASKWGREVMRVLKPEGSLFLNVAGAPSRPFIPFHLVSVFSVFAVLQNTFHWIKSISIENGGTYTRDGKELATLSVGHFKPLSTKFHVNDMHEYVFHYSKAGKAPLNRKAVGVPYVDKSNVKRWKDSGGSDVRCRGNTWFVPYRTIQNRNKQRPHPATFPPELAEMAFKIAGAGSQSTLMDIFVGIGNAGVAASRVSAKKFIGIDIEPFYIEEARERIEREETSTTKH